MIGILDWGIGGVGFYRELRARVPHAEVVYFSDAAFTPYGKVPSDRLAARVLTVAGQLQALGATRLVVACNAASSVLPKLGIDGKAGELITPAGPIPTTGIIAHAIDLVKEDGAKRIGIIGGVRTIRSGVYRRALSRAASVQQRVAQPLSAIIEAGKYDIDLEDALQKILRPFHDIDALLLACTHYPAIKSRFEAHLPGVRILDPAPMLGDWVERNWPMPKRSGAARFMTTGDPRAMRAAAQSAFQVDVGSVLKVRLPSR